MRTALRRTRIAFNKSQQQIADSIGVTVRMYQYIETGRRNPSWAVAQKLETFFGIPASELLAEEEETQKMEVT